MNGVRDNAIGQTLGRKLGRAGPLTEQERAALATLPFRVRVYARGEVIVEQGESPDECALLLAGIAFRYKLLPDGQRQIVSLQVPGDVMDLHSYVLIPLDHAIAAAAPSRVARVPHAAITSLLDQHPRLARPLMWDMARGRRHQPGMAGKCWSPLGIPADRPSVLRTLFSHAIGGIGQRGGL